MKTRITLALALPILLLGCSEAPPTQPPPPLNQRLTVTEWDKVKISDSGEMFVNKKSVSMAEFAAECQRLKQAGGAALIYTGDGPHVLSPAQAEAVQKLVVAGVPMKVAVKESELD